VIVRKLKEIDQDMILMTTQKDLAHFLKNPENAQKVNGLVEDTRYALIDYQVRAPKLLTRIVSNAHYRHRYNWISTTMVVSRS